MKFPEITYDILLEEIMTTGKGFIFMNTKIIARNAEKKDFKYKLLKIFSPSSFVKSVSPKDSIKYLLSIHISDARKVLGKIGEEKTAAILAKAAPKDAASLLYSLLENWAQKTLPKIEINQAFKIIDQMCKLDRSGQQLSYTNTKYINRTAKILSDMHDDYKNIATVKALLSKLSLDNKMIIFEGILYTEDAVKLLRLLSLKDTLLILRKMSDFDKAKKIFRTINPDNEEERNIFKTLPANPRNEEIANIFNKLPAKDLDKYFDWMAYSAKLPKEYLADILRMMKPTKAAKALSKMLPALAADILAQTTAKESKSFFAKMKPDNVKEIKQSIRIRGTDLFKLKREIVNYALNRKT
ncbi:magnesium transporter MgtE N-terminal domain-containing protein [Candidatus Margulisiibacteriota bacterium]